MTDAFLAGFDVADVDVGDGVTIHAAFAGRRLAMSLLALWGARSTVGELYDVEATWQAVAADARGAGLPSGHLVQEERPAEVARALQDVLRETRP